MVNYLTDSFFSWYQNSYGHPNCKAFNTFSKELMKHFWWCHCMIILTPKKRNFYKIYVCKCVFLSQVFLKMKEHEYIIKYFIHILNVMFLKLLG